MGVFSAELMQLLDHFSQRMRFVNLVTCLTQRTKPEQIRSAVPDDNQLTNLILAVLVFIMDRTLRYDDRCTMENVEQFLSQLCPAVGLEQENYGPLAHYIVVTVLQNGGKLWEYPVIDGDKAGFVPMTIQLISEENGSYQLTDDVYEFLFRTREMDSEYEFSVTRFKLQESLKRSRYQDAVAQSRELINRIRSMKRNMESFLFRCRENIATVPIDEFERVMKRVHALLEEEEKPLLTIQSLSKQRLEQLKSDRSADRETLQKARSAIGEIIGNIGLTIQEQRSLINQRTGLARQYDQLVRDQMSFRSFQHFSIEDELLRPFWTMDAGSRPMGEFAIFLFYPVSRPQLPSYFSLENLYAPQSSNTERRQQEGVLLKSQESEAEGLQKERNERHREIITTLFAYGAGHSRFTLEEYWGKLSEGERERVCVGNALLMVLLQLYEMGRVSVREWKESQETVFEPRGEFELSWCLSQLPEDLLAIQELRVYNSEETCELQVRAGEGSKSIRITNFVMEVDKS